VVVRRRLLVRAGQSARGVCRRGLPVQVARRFGSERAGGQLGQRTVRGPVAPAAGRVSAADRGGKMISPLSPKGRGEEEKPALQGTAHRSTLSPSSGP